MKSKLKKLKLFILKTRKWATHNNIFVLFIEIGGSFTKIGEVSVPEIQKKSFQNI